MGILSSKSFQTGMVEGFFGSVNKRRSRKQEIADNVAEARRKQEAEQAKSEYDEASKRAKAYKQHLSQDQINETEGGFTQQYAESILYKEFKGDEKQIAMMQQGEPGNTAWDRMVKEIQASGRALHGKSLDDIEKKFVSDKQRIDNIRSKRQYTNWDRLGSSAVDQSLDYIKKGFDEVRGRPAAEGGSGSQAQEAPKYPEGGDPSQFPEALDKSEYDRRMAEPTSDGAGATSTPYQGMPSVGTGPAAGGISEAENADIDAQIEAGEAVPVPVTEGAEFEGTSIESTPPGPRDPRSPWAPIGSGNEIRDYPKGAKEVKSWAAATDVNGDMYQIARYADGTFEVKDTGLDDNSWAYDKGAVQTFRWTNEDTGEIMKGQFSFDGKGNWVEDTRAPDKNPDGTTQRAKKPFQSPLYDDDKVKADFQNRNRTISALTELYAATDDQRGSLVDWSQGKLREIVDAGMANFPFEAWDDSRGDVVADILAGEISKDAAGWGFFEAVRKGEIKTAEARASFSLARTMLGANGRLSNQMLETAKTALFGGGNGGFTQQAAVQSLLISFEGSARRSMASASADHNDTLSRLPETLRKRAETDVGYIFFSDTNARRILSKYVGLTGEDLEAQLKSLKDARESGKLRKNEEGVPVGVVFQRMADNPEDWEMYIKGIYNE